MSKTVLSQAIKAGIPLVLGAIGGLTATLYPAYHAAFCSGSF